MSLERKDVRFKLPADIKELLDAIAIARGRDLGELVEGWVVAAIEKEVDEASVLMRQLDRLGKAGRARGIAGRIGE
jgi:hypothetical protein